MRCWYCQESLIWDSDDIYKLDDSDEGQKHLVTHLSCPKCEAEVVVSIPADRMTVEL